MWKKTEETKTCIEDPNYVETRKAIKTFERRFKFYLLFSVFYGLIFLNYIDIITPGGVYGGYHLWLSVMYFFPFVALTLSFPRNWQLTLGLGLVASLMNDVFYGLIKNFVTGPYDLTQYYTLWLTPSGATLVSFKPRLCDIACFLMDDGVVDLRANCSCLFLGEELEGSG